jgi:hypothetical protein
MCSLIIVGATMYSSIALTEKRTAMAAVPLQHGKSTIVTYNVLRYVVV